VLGYTFTEGSHEGSGASKSMVVMKDWRIHLQLPPGRRLSCGIAAMVPVAVAALLCGGVNELRAQQATPPEAAPIPAVTTPDLLPPISEVSPQTASTTGPSVTAYSSFDWSHVFNVFPSREYKSTSYSETAGLNIALNPNVTVGAGVSFTQSNSRLLYLENGRSRTDGVGGFATISVNIDNLFTIGGSFQYNTYDNSQFRTIGGLPSAAKYGAESLSASAYVSKYIPINETLFITPQIRLQYSESDSKSYFETTGIFNPRSTSILGRLSIGGQVGLGLSVGDWAVAPNVEAFFLYDYHLPLYQTDRTGVELRPGVFVSKSNVFTANDNLALGASYVTILGRRDYSTFDGGRGFLSYQF
jgi:outer membrane autotransporter protein